MRVGKVFFQKGGWRTGLLVKQDGELLFYTFGESEAGGYVVRAALRKREYREARQAYLQGRRYPIGRCLQLLKRRAGGALYDDLRRIKAPLPVLEG